MRTLLLTMLIFSFSSLAFGRVKENIKQQSVSTSEDGSSAVEVKKPKKKK